MTFSIISNNCWGSDYYSNNNIEYKTPFVGLFIHAPCYIKLLMNFNDYMNLELYHLNKSKYGETKYPIGTLGDIEIHFLHERSFEIAKEKWDRRKKRMDEPYFVKFCDRDNFDKQYIEFFNSVPFKHKVLFLSSKFKNTSPSIVNIAGECPTGNKLYKKWDVNKVCKRLNYDLLK